MPELVRRIFTNRVARRLLIVAALLITYQVWLLVQSTGKVEPGVGENPGSDGRFPVDVVLDFPPERFHILELQNHGRISGTDDTVVHLGSVSPAGTDALARLYWVDSIAPGEEN